MADLPEAIETLAVLWVHPDEDDTPVAATMLDVMGALLPRCLSADGTVLESKRVQALADWLSACERHSMFLGKDDFSLRQLTDWLVELDNIPKTVNSDLLSAANG
jgi:tubulin polyglutamylase TTLL5